MNRGVRGRLLAPSFLRTLLPTNGVIRPPATAARGLRELSQRIASTLGSASGLRAVTDVALVPLLEILGFTLGGRRDEATLALVRAVAGPRLAVLAISTRWGEALDGVWRQSVTEAIGIDAGWCLCCNGRVLRMVDTRRTWSRDYLEFDLVILGEDEETQNALWALAGAESLSSEPPRIETAVELARRHGVQVCRALGAGVLEALETLVGAMARQGQRPAGHLWEHALTVVYRVLFLLFAEARGLVPIWHPIYRDRYSLEAIVETLLEGGTCRGLWRTLQAIARMAHAGCAAADLKVTPFNGRLFAPAHASAFDNSRVSDSALARAVVAVSSTPTTQSRRRSRIAYRDLDVEQLGAVYEQVLEYEPASAAAVTLRRTREIRKASGTFYTPRRLTMMLVERTLGPLVQERSADEILSLRVLDPAMGSGAFLVASCRYLAAAIESALVREGRWSNYDVTASDRALLRREVASRCLFGVDVNPTAVQLARLSLWLATLAADRPLSFLDHHLLAGDSLLGATWSDVRRQPGGTGKKGRPDALPLFDALDLPSAMDQAARDLAQLSAEPDDSVDIVRSKERRVRALRADDSRLTKWSHVLDLWCAHWFWPQGAPPDRPTFLDLMARLLGEDASLPPHICAQLLETARRVSVRRRFLHWPLVFPDVFGRDHSTSAGFDAIVGNPPWDMVRNDRQPARAPADRGRDMHQVKRFARESGIYRVDSRAHVNLYQLFSERALQLVRPGGRIGLVVPSGLVSDVGAAPFRRHLFDHAEVDEITGFDNRHAIFPVHRSVRFVLLSCSPGRPTAEIRCRFGLTQPEDLDPDRRAPLVLTRRLLARLSGEDDLGIPELASSRDLAILERISASTPQLRSPDGWHVAFSRELNATDDRGLFVPVSRDTALRPVVEGKQVEPFRVALDKCRFALRPDARTDACGPRRSRLAYRDVASASNRLTLIAAIVPARAVTTHTLFCLRTVLPASRQRVLCALLNSFVANYLVRLRVNTHLTVSLVSRLPVPLVDQTHESFHQLSVLSEALALGTGPVEDMVEYHESQAIAAHLWGVTGADLEHVLSTFPLVSGSVRGAVLDRFTRLR